MTNPTRPVFNQGDLVRVWPRLSLSEERTHECIPLLALFVEQCESLYWSVCVRHVNKLRHTVWVHPDQLELVQRGEQ